MPTYSYSCKDCGHAFDIQQAFSDDALTVCPSCGGPLRKVFSAVGVVFKGSGFYRTDSRSTSSAGDTAATTSTTTSTTAPAAGSSATASPSTSSSSSSSAGSAA